MIDVQAELERIVDYLTEFNPHSMCVEMFLPGSKKGILYSLN